MKKSTKKLLAVYRSLPDDVAQQLLDYADFLSSRYNQDIQVLAEPENIPRPDEEAVVAAVKRLSSTFPMVDKDHLLNETAALVSEHMLQGRDAVEVIDQLEVIFRRHYDILLEEEKSKALPNSKQGNME